jgi:hypothetical protein
VGDNESVPPQPFGCGLKRPHWFEAGARILNF